MGQILVAGGQPIENLARAVEMIEKAAADRCRVVVLPECLDFGWSDPSAVGRAQPIPGPHSDQLRAAARENHIWVVAGLVEAVDDRLYNTALLISPDGVISLSHRKINELALAHDLYSLGTSVAVAETELGRVGLAVCADNFPDSPELGGALGRMGCRLLLSPCAWAVDGDHDNDAQPYGTIWRESYRALTERYPMTIVAVSNVGWMTGGPWTGRKCIGCSMAVGPGGVILAQAPYGEAAETLVVVDVAVSADAASVSAVAASRV
jgi:predicted amidohydrolase